MATRMEIKYAIRTNKLGAHECIASVGGGFAGNRWQNSQQQIIDWIDDGSFDYFVEQDGREINVIVATSESGHRYLKTVSDDKFPHSLLNLPGFS